MPTRRASGDGSNPMPFLIGITLAVAVAVFARWIGLDRDRSFYPTVMIVIASLYVLFAAIGGGSPTVMLAEIAIGAAFIALTIAGFKRSLWLVVAALAGHGIFDFVHPHAFHNPGVPLWWPDFCMAYDVAAAVILAWLLHRRRIPTPTL